MITLTINGETHSYSGDEDKPLLWFLRGDLRKTGTKFGCGIAQCGACTVHVDGAAMRSCSVPMAMLDGSQVTTIEGLAKDGRLTAVQRAWIEEDVPQCGYCQAGQIMAVTEFLENFPNPSDRDINENLDNLCRCGTYSRIRKAIHRAAHYAREGT